MRKNQKIFFSLAVGIALALIGYFLTSAAVSNAAPRELDKPQRTDVTGYYHQIANGIPNTEISAVISKDHIEMTLRLKNPDSEGDVDPYGDYWSGTFNTKNATDKFDYTSRADGSQGMYMSEDKTKDFSYDNGELMFSFSIYGMTTPVVLSR